MLSRIEELIARGARFLITSHIDPDGDAVGSVLALDWALRSMDKTTRVYLKDKVPYRYDFLPGVEHVVNEVPAEAFDAVFVLDCGSIARVGEDAGNFLRESFLVCIDHHKTNDAFANLDYVDPQASSTGELLYRLFAGMGLKYSLEMAINIYTAVFTDTGSLRYDNASTAAYAICREMVGLGVQPAYVAQRVYESHPKERFLLLGEVLCTLRTFDDGKIAVARVTEEMFRKTGTDREHTDGFSEYIREIRGVEAAIFARQTGPEKFKISMRAKGLIDVAHICSTFGGGGHKNAAGCTIDGSYEEVEAKLLKTFSLTQ